jgi:hypothetical protein
MPAFIYSHGEGQDVRFFGPDGPTEDEAENATRAPEFDGFEALGYIPAKAYLDNGWYLECNYCDRRSDDEEEPEEDDDDEYWQDWVPVEDTFSDGGSFYFCCPKCHQQWKAEHDRQKADQDTFRDNLTAKYPELLFLFLCGCNKTGIFATVEFPGGEGSLNQAPNSTEINLWTSNTDAWMELYAQTNKIGESC